MATMEKEKLAQWTQILEKVMKKVTPQSLRQSAGFVFNIVQTLITLTDETGKVYFYPKILPTLKTVQEILGAKDGSANLNLSKSYDTDAWKKILSEIEGLKDENIKLLCDNYILFMRSQLFDNGEYEKMPVFFAPFIRVETATKVFAAIRKAQPKRLYVFSDGPREGREGEKEKVEFLRKYIVNNVDWDCELLTKFEEKNLGIGKGMGGAIRWFWEREEMGIILEDDIVPAPSFFRFASECLIKYKDDDRITFILGTNKTPEGLSSNTYSFKKVCDFTEELTQLWGIATWKRTYAKFDNPIPHLEKYKAQIKTEEDTEDYARHLKNMRAKYLVDQTEVVVSGQNDAPDIVGKLSMLMNDKYFIIPDCNLVTNIGCGVADAAHGAFEYAVGATLVPGEFWFPIKHPDSVESKPLLPKDYARLSYTILFRNKEYWDLEITATNDILTIGNFLNKSGLPPEQRNELLRPYLAEKLFELLNISVFFKKYHDAQKYFYLALVRSLFRGEQNFCSKCTTRDCLFVCPTASVSPYQKEGKGEIVININRQTCLFCFTCMKSCRVVRER